MARRPNILFLLNDHQSYYGHGADRAVRPLRPHFDRLAAGGISYSHAHCVTPLCGPARRTILSGLFPHNHGNHFNYSDAPFKDECYLDALKGGGYRNYYYGKWHAGPGTALDHGCEGFSPHEYGNPYITDEYRRYLAETGLPTAEHHVEGYLWSEDFLKQFPSLGIGPGYRCGSFWCGENAYGVTTTPKETHESYFLADMACRRLERLAAAPSDQPFSLRVDFWGPHQPHFPTQEFLDLYDPSLIDEYPSFGHKPSDRPAYYNMALRPLASERHELLAPNPWPWERWSRILQCAYAHISMVDAAGGMILDTLERLGLAENTLVIWTTDHGDALASHGGQWDKGSYMSEEVMRVPFAMRMPGRIPPGKKSDDFISEIDIAPTILDAAGLAFRGEVDGRSLLPRACGQATWREDLMAETHGHGYGRYVVSRLLYAGNHKYIVNEGHRNELYDLAADPYELRNIADEPESAAIIADMGLRLAAWRERTRDPAAHPAVDSDPSGS